ncbi:uncharacterized protein LOC143549977 [Bidens hawaiensis]|uniref:uncharacterized protein LOC143549977 n=1 Tax=Bidens hawaiensis TaxID=980011 RepID=UPI004049B87D
MDAPNMSIKLLVDRKISKVLFAEAPKEFVDLLFSIFSLPLGTLFESDKMLGVGVNSLGKLKDSIQSFHGNYLQPGIKVDDIFNPKTASFNTNTFFFRNSDVDQSGTAPKVYTCPKASSDKQIGYGKLPCGSYATLHGNIAVCPTCYMYMSAPMTLVKPETNEEDKNKNIGYVKEVVTYMVMDDLVLKPMSTISSITLLNKCGVNDLSQLEEKVVSFRNEEGMKLLNASLKTDKVLTSIFFLS